jgi:hypothetical protein
MTLAELRGRVSESAMMAIGMALEWCRTTWLLRALGLAAAGGQTEHSSQWATTLATAGGFRQQ